MFLTLLSFLTEDYGLVAYFPSYGDSARFSVNYYTGSRYPLFIGCFRGFCLYAGTYAGFYRDSTFYLRDHRRIIDTIDLRRSAVQEWAVLSRFFYSGNLLMGFEAGLMRETYSSVLRSYNDVFPDNRLSLGNERRGMLFGGVMGYVRGDASGYLLFRYRNITKDSSISSGDTTGWVITVPQPPEGNLELLLHLRYRWVSLNVSKRGRLAGYVRTEGVLRGFPFAFSLGYAPGTGPVLSGAFGLTFREVLLMVGGAYAGGPTLGVGVRYPYP